MYTLMTILLTIQEGSTANVQGTLPSAALCRSLSEEFALIYSSCTLSYMSSIQGVCWPLPYFPDFPVLKPGPS